ncbi:MAG: hypothetical protein WBB19_09445 [Desulforhopalus sp.]
MFLAGKRIGVLSRPLLDLATLRHNTHSSDRDCVAGYRDVYQRIWVVFR